MMDPKDVDILAGPGPAPQVNWIVVPSQQNRLGCGTGVAGPVQLPHD